MSLKSRLIYIPVGRDEIQGDLFIPEKSTSIVVFAHGSGSSRHSPRNKYVAGLLNDAGIATLLIDLLTPDEELIDFQTSNLRFDIDLLAHRLTDREQTPIYPDELTARALTYRIPSTTRHDCGRKSISSFSLTPCRSSLCCSRR